MAAIDRLIEISKIVTMLSESFLYARCVPKLAMTVVFASITGLLSGALLMGGLYVGYLALIQCGIGAGTAIFTVGMLTLIMAVVCAFITHRLVRNMKNMLLPLNSGLLQRIEKAFLDGFNHSEKR